MTGNKLGTQAKLVAVCATLGSERALVLLREIGSAHLGGLPQPLGFGRGGVWGAVRERRLQHETGPDPP